MILCACNFTIHKTMHQNSKLHCAICKYTRLIPGDPINN